MSENNYTVYVHISPNGKKYIGITGRSVEKRWENGNAYKNNKYFVNAIKKYGWDNFIHEILCINLSEKEAKSIEIELISKHKSNNSKFGYNISSGGESASGRIMSAEARKKISNAQKGKITTPETRKKIGAANKGKHPSDESRRKMSEAKKGATLSDRSRKKISESMSGIKNYNVKPVMQYDLNGNFMKRWDYMKQITKVLGYNQGNVWACCKGIRKKAYGFIWKYA